MFYSSLSTILVSDYRGKMSSDLSPQNMVVFERKRFSNIWNEAGLISRLRVQISDDKNIFPVDSFHEDSADELWPSVLITTEDGSAREETVGGGHPVQLISVSIEQHLVSGVLLLSPSRSDEAFFVVGKHFSWET